LSAPLVEHKKYGKGTIKGERYLQNELLVHFCDGIERWVLAQDIITPEYRKKNYEIHSILKHFNIGQSKKNGSDNTKQKNEIEVKKDTAPISVEKKDTAIDFSPISELNIDSLISNISRKSTPTLIPDRHDLHFEARSIIEALRVGIVPQNQTHHFTCGRETELSQVQKWQQSETGSMMLLGEYGSGKSHMLELIIGSLIKKGWAVSSIEIDPNESPFNQPKKIYQKIVKSLVYQKNEKNCSIQDFIQDLVDSSNPFKNKIKKHSYLGNLLHAYENKELYPDLVYLAKYYDDPLMSWFMGEIPNISRLPKLVEYQTSSNIYCNILSGIGWVAQNILGLKGLLILMDEAEGIDKTWYTQYQSDRAGNFLKGLILTTNNDKRRLAHLEYYRNNSDLPYIWGDRSNIKLILSFTPPFKEYLQNNILVDPALYSMAPVLELKPLQKEHMNELFQKIQSFYTSAYGFDPQVKNWDNLPNNKTRSFVKSSVELMDIIRFNPTSYKEQIDRIKFLSYLENN
jgi:hypothetical protein